MPGQNVGAPGPGAVCVRGFLGKSVRDPRVHPVFSIIRPIISGNMDCNTLSRIAGLSDRLSTLEQFISYPPNPVKAPAQDPGHHSRDGDGVNGSQIDPNTPSHPPSSRAPNARPPDGNVASHRATESPAVAENVPIHQVSEAQRFIQQELQHSDHLSLNRRTVLENALPLVNKLSSSSLESRLFSGNIKHAEDQDVSDLEEFSLETYLMMSMSLYCRTS